MNTPPAFPPENTVMRSNWRHVAQVFRKDGTEILRDRRTLFVNVLLPVLLYPLLMLFVLQVAQLTGDQPREPAVVLIADLPSELSELLQPTEPNSAADAESKTAAPKKPAAKPTEPKSEAVTTRRGLGADTAPVSLKLVVSTAASLRTEVAALIAADRHDDATRVAKARVLTRLREAGAAAALVRLPETVVAKRTQEQPRFAMVSDDAHPQADAVEARLSQALSLYRQRLVERRLAAVGLAADALAPLTISTLHVAPPSESARTRLAGLLPVLLVLLAVSGAFITAVDLVAGERERGTLETLLSWPVRRRDVFIGKLLVVCVAAAASVGLNLLSAGATVAIGTSQLGASAGAQGAFLSAGAGALVLCFVVLLPLTVTLGAVALALTGLASSVKEAQNYLAPLILAAMVAAGVALLPHARPTLALDLIPVTGVVLALKESLQATAIPWLHLGLSAATSLALAAVVVGWSARRFDQESFRYPGLVRAGWGRFRKWGPRPDAPGGIEALLIFAVAVAGMVLAGGFFQHANAAVLVAGPLLLFVAAPALLHTWFGAYDPRVTLGLRLPANRAWLGTAIALPAAIACSLGLGLMQSPWVPSQSGDEQLTKIIADLHTAGGWPLLVLCVAVTPGVCEELLCRGTLLSGLTRGVGMRSGVILSAFLFAILHLSPYRFLPQFVLGVFLALFALRNRSILPGMLIHAGHNAVVVVFSVATAWQTLPLIQPLLALAERAPLPIGAVLAAIGLAGLCYAWRQTKARSTPSE